MRQAIRTVQAKPLLPERPLAFSILRVPFFLEPDYDEAETFSETNRARLLRKWGGPAGWAAQKKRHDLKGRAAAAGIHEHFNLDRLASSTQASHRVVQFVAKRHGLPEAEELHDALNRAHFIDGRALNDAEMLASLASRHAGADAREVRSLLASDDGRAEIEACQELLRRYGISSIPKFVVNGTHLIDGAAPAEDHVALFRAIERAGEEGEPVFAAVLGIPPATFDRPSHPAV